MVTVTVAAVLAIRNLSDDRGEAAVEDLRAARLQVRAALYGWQPPDCDSPIMLGRSKVLGFERPTVWWQDDFIGSYLEVAAG